MSDEKKPEEQNQDQHKSEPDKPRIPLAYGGLSNFVKEKKKGYSEDRS